MLEILKKNKQKTPDQPTVKEIHSDFMGKVNELLEFAEEETKKEYDSEKADKAERLRKLGFRESKETKEGDSEIKKKKEKEKEKERKSNIKEAINYFSTKYPQYRFITEESVRSLCEKYGLVYATVDRYLGEVPDKNLKDIENFQIKDEDKCYLETHSRFSLTPTYKKVSLNKIDKEVEQVKEARERTKEEGGDPHKIANERQVRNRYREDSLYIAASYEDFNTRGMKVENKELVEEMPKIPDPIVLQPVMYKNSRYFLIVTAWGDEAEDEEVVNHKMN